MKPWSARRRIGLLILALAAAIVAVDFLRFVDRAERYGLADAAPADAVVALTGGKGLRVAAAGQFAETEDLPLLVSGVYPNLDRAEVMELLGVEESFFECCVTLGRRAASTSENGLETANWARAEGYERMIVVTSGYHMDRALIELRRFMPEADFVAYAIDSGDLTPSRWWRSVGDARRTFMQWLKYRGAYARGLMARPGTAP